MTRTVSLLVLMFLGVAASPAFAQRKACEELKAEIAAKLDAKGVKNYMLTVVPVAEVKDGDTVVGSCDGGASRIVYVRN